MSGDHARESQRSQHEGVGHQALEHLENRVDEERHVRAAQRRRLHGLPQRLRQLGDGRIDPEAVQEALSQPPVFELASTLDFEELKNWRNELVDSGQGLTPFTVASNTTLKNIARRRPYSLEELANVSEVRAWQVRDHGEAILAVLDQVAPDE